MGKSKKTATILPDCVACGCCVKVCPLGAITVWNGIRAQVNPLRCVGCGKCAQACPADVIVITNKEENHEEAKAVV
ncbi:4Fe-4S dicluster domain-containing protein [Clostridium merdae]|uniref:4Fe-4S dicluster domain-containing protein n=1 Tax=Clostridium merdae TaxID=1958780 RepID=UPI000A26F684|nr:4Fe-4S dicluster domain-containing protein [Clostridium merdae]